ncbi:MAG TPA: hypothetical protein VFA07_00110 [Chthonomonadaceae bacterium]|nr:hypothetical protein [Chthonomonadaceae bacterium]
MTDQEARPVVRNTGKEPSDERGHTDTKQSPQWYADTDTIGVPTGAGADGALSAGDVDSEVEGDTTMAGGDTPMSHADTCREDKKKHHVPRSSEEKR